MRCPDCQKFVAYDTDQEPEPEDEAHLDSSGSFTATYRRVLACAECGTDLKEAVIDVGGELSTELKCKDGAAAHEWVLISCAASPTSGRRSYGVACVVETECGKCGVKLTEVEFEAELGAGFFDQMI